MTQDFRDFRKEMRAELYLLKKRVEKLESVKKPVVPKAVKPKAIKTNKEKPARKEQDGSRNTSDNNMHTSVERK